MKHLPALIKGIFSITALWGLTCMQPVFAQKIENQKQVFDQSRQILQIYYDVTGLNYRKELRVTPMLELADGQQIDLPDATGAIGMMKKNSKGNLIELDPFKAGIERPEQAKIILVADIRKRQQPERYLLGLQGSNSAPLGLKFWRVAPIGAYVGFRLGALPPSYRYTVNNEGQIDYKQVGIYEIVNQRRLASLAATTGVVAQIAPKLYGTLGIGYGIEQLFWKYNEYDLDKNLLGKAWALNENINHKGTIAEVGISCFLKPVYVELGVATFALNSYQLLFGLAYVFEKKQ